MKIVVPRTWPEEDRRVALTPEIASRFIQQGCTVLVEEGAGVFSGWSDQDYEAVSAKIAPSNALICKDADLVLVVGPPSYSIPTGTHLVGLLGGLQANLKDFSKTKAFSLELLPRISRAQTMDILSSQNNLRGYCAITLAASTLNRLFPMMTTAAGTLYPAHVLVLGVGVAGLQAIATARRLGAIVSAMDVRQAAKEQAESVGAVFLSVDSEESGDTASGYAKEMSALYRKRQKEVLHGALAKADVVVCTALIPGKSPPLLLEEEDLHYLKPNSLVIDLAADQPILSEEQRRQSPHGNCSVSQRGKTVQHKDSLIIAPLHTLNAVSRDASTLYARNLFHFIQILWQGGEFRKPDEDELLQATYLKQKASEEETGC